MSLTLSPISAEVPANLECIISNERWQELVALLSIVLPDGVKETISATEPAPSERIWPWMRLNSDGTPDRRYIYANGKWMSKHLLPVGAVIMYQGTEASIPTYDGGAAGAISATSGPFWERVTEMDAKMPIGPGTLPGGTVLAVGDGGGVETVTLTLAQIPAHSHGFVDGSNFLRTDNNGTLRKESGSNANAVEFNSEGGGQSHSNMPPYEAIWFIRRTNRTHYVAP